MKDKRIHVLMDEAELKALDAWRYANKIGSRGEAVRRLVYIGVAASAPWVYLSGDFKMTSGDRSQS